MRSAQTQLREHAGIRPRGYTKLEEMLAREELDAVAVLSPHETHETYLRRSAEAGLHVLCEKPLIWGGGRLAERTRECIDMFRSRALLLAENCQWPYVLPAFRALHPGAASRAPRSFSMRLSPISCGLQLLADGLSHPLSLLQELAPSAAPTVEGVRCTLLGPDRKSLSLGFDYCANGARVAVEVRLISESGFPRAAWIEIDGHRAERAVWLPDYSIALEDGERSVAVPDPLTARVRAFLADLEAVRGGARPPGAEPILARMAMLEILADSYRERGGKLETGTV